MSQLGQKLKLISAPKELLYRNDGDGGVQPGDILIRSEHHASNYPNHSAPSGWSTAWAVNAPGNWASFSSTYRQQHVGAYRIADGSGDDNYAQHWWRWTGGPITSVSKVFNTQWTSHPGNRTYNMSSYESSDSIGTVAFEGMYFWGKTSNRTANILPDNGYHTGSDFQAVFGRKTDEGVTFQTSGGSATGPGASYSWWYIGGAAILKLYA
jgi:hypothetical protein